jgi:arylsulfatase
MADTLLSRRAFLGSVAAAGATVSAQQAGRRPNIILILADDLGYSDIGCYGSEIATPHLDKMAQEGVRFTQFYNTARCCPTRASLLTGLYPHQAGIGHMMDDRKLPAYRGDLNRHCVTIAQVMHRAGYRTMMCGKWHVTPVNDIKHNWPLQRGFDQFYGTIHGAGSFYDPATLSRDNAFVEPDRKDFYYTDSLADQAAEWVGAAANGQSPFFLYLAFTSPHWPLHALESDIAKYKGRYRGGWDALRAERHRKMIEQGIVKKDWPMTPRDASVPEWKDAPDKEWQERRMEVYAAQVDRMDQGIGRVLAKLKETGIEKDTLVLFLADNGGCAEHLGPVREGTKRALHIPEKTRDGRAVREGNDPKIVPGADDTYQSYGIGWANASNTPFRMYKHWVHEGGISTPLIARWTAGIPKPGTLTDQPGHLVDIMATCVDLAGVAGAYPKSFEDQPITPMEGRSLAPILKGGQRPAAPIYWEHEGNRAIREGKWKLVSKYPGDWELYDLQADRTELQNLAAQNPAKVKQLSAKWEAWARKVQVEPWDKVRRG